MSAYDMDVELREGTGKGVARKLRSAGRIPAVLYGLGREPRSLSVDTKVTEKYLRDISGTTLIKLKIGEVGEEIFVIVRDYQVDPVEDGVIHVDFLEVDLAKKTVVDVPLEFTGKAKGVEMGGQVEVIRRSVEVRCLPGQIPSFFTVDITSLEIGDVLHMKHIPMPEEVEALDDPEIPIVSVQEIVIEEEEVPEEEEALEEGEPEGSEEDTEED
jgi:large subunit ribosomal protein L25